MSDKIELRGIVTDALIGMISAVVEMSPPAGAPIPPFIQSAIDRAVERIASALAQQPAPVVPDGWKLVPVEPTPEMLSATSWPGCAGADYAKMISAAPAAPVAQEPGYPPCDYCGSAVDYMPWHGSGMIDGIESRHIHACDTCRHLLPAAEDPDTVPVPRELLERLDRHYQDGLSINPELEELRALLSKENEA